MKQQTLAALILLLILPLALPAAADDHDKGECKDHSCEPPQPPRPPRPICLNVFCNYREDGAPNDSVKCEAGAVFEKLVTDDGEEIHDNSENLSNPRFEVACDKKTLFNGSAHRFTDAAGTRIQAEIGPYPAVVLPRHALREGHRYEASVLELAGGATLHGYCFIYTGPQ